MCIEHLHVKFCLDSDCVVCLNSIFRYLCLGFAIVLSKPCEVSGEPSCGGALP